MLSTSRPGYEPRSIPISGMLVCDNPKVVLCSHSIGMGLVVAAYDPGSHVGGLFHALLPDTKSNLARSKEKPCMFLDSGLESLQLALLASGAVATRLRYYAVGGAQVMGASANLNIGLKNTNALQTLLDTRGIKLTNSHLGGHTCRSFHLSIETGEASVQLSGQLNEISL